MGGHDRLQYLATRFIIIIIIITIIIYLHKK